MYSWLKPGVEAFNKMQEVARVPHALLITVGPSLGGGVLARELARKFLCLEQGRVDCTCRSCICFNADTHPDFHTVGIGENINSILIDDIRKGIGVLVETSGINHGKVLYIEGAERMNVAASNALLKTLEEPPQGTLIILSTGKPQSLLPTIMSRCMRLTIPYPKVSELNEFLQQKLNNKEDYSLELAVLGQSPLKVLECVERKDHLLLREGASMAADAIEGKTLPITAASFLDKKISDPDLVYGLLYGIIKEGLAFQAGVSAQDLTILKNRPQALNNLAQISPLSLSEALSKILALKQVPSIKTSYVNVLQLVTWFTLLNGSK